jgi:hypothetical protein
MELGLSYCGKTLMRALENRVLEPRWEVRGAWRILLNEESHNLCITKRIWSRRM